MHQGDTRKLISVLYVLTLLFLGAIYFQGKVISEPGAVATLQNLDYSPAESHSIQLLNSFQLNGETALITVISLTLFFGFALIMTHSKSY